MIQQLKLFLRNMKFQLKNFVKAIKWFNDSLLDCYNTIKQFNKVEFRLPLKILTFK